MTGRTSPLGLGLGPEEVVAATLKEGEMKMQTVQRRRGKEMCLEAMEAEFGCLILWIHMP